MNISSLSEAAGLEAGDLLLAVNGEDVESNSNSDRNATIVRSYSSIISYLEIVEKEGDVESGILKVTEGG